MGDEPDWWVQNNCCLLWGKPYHNHYSRTLSYCMAVSTCMWAKVNFCQVAFTNKSMGMTFSHAGEVHDSILSMCLNLTFVVTANNHIYYSKTKDDGRKRGQHTFSSVVSGFLTMWKKHQPPPPAYSLYLQPHLDAKQSVWLSYTSPHQCRKCGTGVWVQCACTSNKQMQQFPSILH